MFSGCHDAYTKMFSGCRPRSRGSCDPQQVAEDARDIFSMMNLAEVSFLPRPDALEVALAALDQIKAMDSFNPIVTIIHIELARRAAPALSLIAYHIIPSSESC
jgi:hypothetical protein